MTILNVNIKPRLHSGKWTSVLRINEFLDCIILYFFLNVKYSTENRTKPSPENL